MPRNVADGVAQGAGGADDAAFPGALDAQRVVGRGGLFQHEVVDGRQIRATRRYLSPALHQLHGYPLCFPFNSSTSVLVGSR